MSEQRRRPTTPLPGHLTPAGYSVSLIEAEIQIELGDRTDRADDVERYLQLVSGATPLVLNFRPAIGEPASVVLIPAEVDVLVQQLEAVRRWWA